jgi:hypothetical protein
MEGYDKEVWSLLGTHPFCEETNAYAKNLEIWMMRDAMEKNGADQGSPMWD